MRIPPSLKCFPREGKRFLRPSEIYLSDSSNLITENDSLVLQIKHMPASRGMGTKKNRFGKNRKSCSFRTFPQKLTERREAPYHIQDFPEQRERNGRLFFSPSQARWGREFRNKCSFVLLRFRRLLLKIAFQMVKTPNP